MITSCQLGFEALPQIVLQAYLLYKIYFDKNKQKHLERTGLLAEGELLDGRLLHIFMISIACSVFDSILSFAQLNAEKESVQTSFSHYFITCLNGRFGWAPFDNIFTDADHPLIKETVSESNAKVAKELDYDDLTRPFCWLTFKQ